MEKNRLVQWFSDRYANRLRLLHLIDYVLFILFAFLFLYRLQDDLLSLTWQRLTGHMPGLSPFAVALLLTLLLVLLKMGINQQLHLKGRNHAISFIPSFILLALITALEPRLPMAKILIFAAALLVFFLLVRFSKRGFRTNDNFWTMACPNLVIMLGGFLFVTLLSNTDEVFHYELSMERRLSRGQYAAALRVGNGSMATSRRLTALRAYSLSKMGQLGSHLFEYPLPEGNCDLFLHPSDAQFLILPVDSARALYGYLPTAQNYFEKLSHAAARLDSSSTSALKDYYLVTLLLKKQLDDFAKTLPHFYSTSQNGLASLPKHYREALILYRSLFVHPRLIYQGSEEEQANYQDFQDVYNKYSNVIMRNNYTRRLYGNTYWWYYHFHK